jgi:CheY-like chemotaxis protein
MTNLQRLPTVLIADDDPDDRLMMKEAFAERYRECRLSFAQDGVQLMRMLNRDEHPDLILLDLNMPLKDGREALQEIKASSALRHIPTIVLTTSVDEDDIRFCYGAGASSYIAKPSTYSEILDVVSGLKSDWIDPVIPLKKLKRHD